MSELTLEDAISHCLEVAEDNETKALRIGQQYEGTLLDRDAKECRRCAADHRQLAEWLTELKQYKEIVNRIYNETTNDHYGNALTTLDNIDKILEETRCLWDKED